MQGGGFPLPPDFLNITGGLKCQANPGANALYSNAAPSDNRRALCVYVNRDSSACTSSGGDDCCGPIRPGALQLLSRPRCSGSVAEVQVNGGSWPLWSWDAASASVRVIGLNTLRGPARSVCIMLDKVRKLGKRAPPPAGVGVSAAAAGAVTTDTPSSPAATVAAAAALTVAAIPDAAATPIAATTLATTPVAATTFTATALAATSIAAAAFAATSQPEAPVAITSQPSTAVAYATKPRSTQPGAPEPQPSQSTASESPTTQPGSS
ncbi:hypothetical protein GPECTOR_1g48 [Gonium pectorale]|uniref:Pherophorin domain-containing protein n=1 Tax=Gonium pectorale TaxID=33097 RepID=A0A150H3B2_GONPE|nr:hypothetical protein GPECTOR_1g48 [Gonium pectorale]|eukprot:KXZ56534.1 hypothetical protein GPECTOR_1g48 [Gonium pectorale]